MTPEKALAAIEKYRLTLFAPAREGGAWLARTNGGIHDAAPMGGTGPTPAAAIEDALRDGLARERVGRVLDEERVGRCAQHGRRYVDGACPRCADERALGARVVAAAVDEECPVPECPNHEDGDTSLEPVADDDAFVDPLG